MSKVNRCLAGIEPLESRVFFTASLGTNLVINGDAEMPLVAGEVTTHTIPYWAKGWSFKDGDSAIAKGATTVAYGASNAFPSLGSPGPVARGVKFFAGGANNQDSTLTQYIDVTSLAADIDAGRISAVGSAYLGGFGSEGDAGIITISFQSAGPQFTTQGAQVLGSVTASARENVTGLFFVSAAGSVPIGTRRIAVFVTLARVIGIYNDGYADNISLSLSSSLGANGQVSGTLYNDALGNGTKDSSDVPLPNVRMFADKDHDGRLDAGEPSGVSHSNGRYTIPGLAPGKYNVLAIVPSKFRASSINPMSVDVVSGLTTTRADAQLSQTAVLSGTVFRDTNSNKTFDASDVALGSVRVYLDINNNGEFDHLDYSTTTNSKGGYRFNVPFGTYTIREVIPAGYKLTGPSPAMSWGITIGKARIWKLGNFANELS